MTRTVKDLKVNSDLDVSLLKCVCMCRVIVVKSRIYGLVKLVNDLKYIKTLRRTSTHNVEKQPVNP